MDEGETHTRQYDLLVWSVYRAKSDHKFILDCIIILCLCTRLALFIDLQHWGASFSGLPITKAFEALLVNLKRQGRASENNMFCLHSITLAVGCTSYIIRLWCTSEFRVVHCSTHGSRFNYYS